VLAAGRGSRVAEITDCKPLLRVTGLPLAERAIATAIRAGVNEFVVVVGHEPEPVERALRQIAQRRHVTIEVARAEDWTAGNGASLLAAREYLDEPFVLLMADHIVSTAILERLIERGLHGDACVLAVDHGTSPWVDPADVTRVRIQDDRIIDINKGLADAEVYDTGVFLCSPEIFDAADEALRRGDATVSGAVRELARRHSASVIDVSGETWIDIDTPRDWKRAQKLLRASTGKARDGSVSRLLNRPLSARVLTPLLLRLYPNVTPNQVSVLSLLVAAASAAAFAWGDPVVGAVALHLASVLDGSDGEVARLKQLESPFGQFFDSVLDRVADSLILFGMLFFAWTAQPNQELLGPALDSVALVIGTLAVTGNWLVSYSTARAALDLNHHYQGRWIGGGKGRDLRLLILTIAGLVAAIHPLAALTGLAAVGVLTIAIVLRRLAVSYTVMADANRLADIEAIIYDFDGTLLDSMPTLTKIATALITERYAIDETFARASYLRTAGADFATQLEEIFPSHPQNAEAAADFELRKERALRSAQPFDDALPTLRLFRTKGVRQFVCSSTREALMGAALKHSGLIASLDGWIGYRPGLDKSRQIDSIVWEHGLDPARTLFVGDSPRDASYARIGEVAFRRLSRSGDTAPSAFLGDAVNADLHSLFRSWNRATRAARSASATGASWEIDSHGVASTVTTAAYASPKLSGHPSGASNADR
jgi:1L-myo-inositol 1-phosphate cytidylyltransferase / CDP-L-myo-inositol myo-inositolphosphotransferase